MQKRTHAIKATSSIDSGWHHARKLVLRYGWNTTAYQILNSNISRWFSGDGTAVIGYVVTRRYRVVAGAPVCAPEQVNKVVCAFEADAWQAGQRVCYLNADEYLRVILAARRPVAHLLLGAEPVWHPQQWITRVSSKASLRAQITRARNKHVLVMPWTADQATNHPDLRRCLQSWLQTRGLPPIQFPFASDTLMNLTDRKVIVATHGGKTVGFLIAAPVPARQGWIIEQIIRSPTAPNGTAELLLDAVMHDLVQSGTTYVTLGPSLLSTRSTLPHTPTPRWTRMLLAGIRVYGRRFCNFDGMDAFKAKFLPERWEPLYLVTNEHRLSLSAMLAVIAACSGNTPMHFLRHALSRAYALEFQRRRRCARHGLLTPIT